MVKVGPYEYLYWLSCTMITHGIVISIDSSVLYTPPICFSGVCQLLVLHCEKSEVVRIHILALAMVRG